ncbi:sodium-coupled neutral amino acid transporter 10-like 1 [Homarus americanus]|uniref:Sodium-coupled neutral amino acid transporter 10-like 1 n=1 Tax=Homarus americanus TaxID=6706 RepID=A0A8J5NBP7_HOMAM|nr:sodium-coupled neutral amino acid transporter 10-like 1 [Homarus americanus]
MPENNNDDVRESLPSLLRSTSFSNVFEIYDSIPDPDVPKMRSVVNQAVNLCCALYIMVGFLGYVAFVDQDLAGNLILNFPNSQLTEGIKVFFTVSLAISFPLMIFPCRTSIHSLLYRRAGFDELESENIEDVLASHTEELPNEDLQQLTEHSPVEEDDDEEEPQWTLTSKRMAESLNMFQQGIQIILDDDPTRERSSKNNPSSFDLVGNYMPEARFKGITLGILTTKFVLGLLGSTMGMLIALILPSILFIKVNSKASAERLLAQTIMLVGIVLIVTGTYLNLAHIYKVQAEQTEVVIANMIKNDLDPNLPNIEKQISKEGKAAEAVPAGGDSATRREPVAPEPPPEDLGIKKEDKRVLVDKDKVEAKETKGEKNNAHSLDKEESRKEVIEQRKLAEEKEEKNEGDTLHPDAIQKEEKVNKEEGNENRKEEEVDKKKAELLEKMEVQHKEQQQLLAVLQESKQILQELKVAKKEQDLKRQEEENRAAVPQASNVGGAPVGNEPVYAGNQPQPVVQVSNNKDQVPLVAGGVVAGIGAAAKEELAPPVQQVLPGNQPQNQVPVGEDPMKPKAEAPIVELQERVQETVKAQGPALQSQGKPQSRIEEPAKNVPDPARQKESPLGKSRDTAKEKDTKKSTSVSDNKNQVNVGQIRAPVSSSPNIKGMKDSQSINNNNSLSSKKNSKNKTNQKKINHGEDRRKRDVDENYLFNLPEVDLFKEIKSRDSIDVAYDTRHLLWNSRSRRKRRRNDRERDDYYWDET